jgi:enamine deaminase RidA (YjgF/YER057c/UK114 family)
MERDYLIGSWEQARSYSPAVITQGGRIVWLAGHTGSRTEAGEPFNGDFAAQTRQCFRNIDATLKRIGGSLADITTMTIFITDDRYGDEFVQVRKEFYTDGKWPGSAMITCAALARPTILIEIVAIAVIDDAKYKPPGR